MAADFGVVVIGRNEGERLRSCFESLTGVNCAKVYVDSDSTDDSLKLAEKYGIVAHPLSPDQPFSAARARNEGFARLLEISPKLEYVQFVDGDCTFINDWLNKAAGFLAQHEKVAAVCGRLHEQFPERSIYNQLCDLEWNTPVGESKASGGIVMMRAAAFQEAGGFRTDLIAGEEPELCFRLREKGWSIWRIDADMAWHDAAILHFNQWWKRTRRAGYAFAEGAFLHGASPERHWVKETRSPWFWAAILPLTALVVGYFNGVAAWLVLSLYPLQISRLALTGKYSPRVNWLRAFFLVLGKFPELLGQLQFLKNRFMKTRGRLIEYK
jgi:GT2 family glycosyltransferase